jgi:hypothetical protein
MSSEPSAGCSIKQTTSTQNTQPIKSLGSGWKKQGSTITMTARVSPSSSSDDSEPEEGASHVDYGAPSETSVDDGILMEDLNYLAELLEVPADVDDLNEIRSSPLFTHPIWAYTKSISAGRKSQAFTQYALLGANVDHSSGGDTRDSAIFYNVTTPSSIFICGNQGSGKSHTLSCFLENALIPTRRLGSLPRPLTGIVFHYDTFNSDLKGAPCEAAFLSSDPMVKVRVLCAPTNIRTMKVRIPALGPLCPLFMHLFCSLMVGNLSWPSRRYCGRIETE